LDRETAGVILFSKNPETRGAYTQLFRERLVTKLYEALAPIPTTPLLFPIVCRSRIMKGEPFFRMTEVEGVPNSETHIERSGQASPNESVDLYTLRPVTGKKHQLRIHMASLGLPIINDRLYPTYERGFEDDFSRPLMLLAKSIEFKDPLTGRESYFESERSSTNFSLC
jgi:tRNA pseudouridine32 synthase/23S rRNA pseudouridine746 synthase